jgi:Amt family ammonium transporter
MHGFAAGDEWTGLDQAEAGERGYIYTDIESTGGSSAPSHPHAPATTVPSGATT